MKRLQLLLGFVKGMKKPSSEMIGRYRRKRLKRGDIEQASKEKNITRSEASIEVTKLMITDLLAPSIDDGMHRQHDRMHLF